MCHVGTPIRATLVSISVGLVILFTTATIARVAEGPIDDKAPFIVVRRGEWWMWIGGSCGVAIIGGSILGVPRLGASAFTAIFTATQLATAIVFDVVGAFGFAPIRPTGRRVAGAVLGVASAVAFQLAPRGAAEAIGGGTTSMPGGPGNSGARCHCTSDEPGVVPADEDVPAHASILQIEQINK